MTKSSVPMVAKKRKEKGKMLFYYSMIAFPLLQFCIFYIGVNFNSILLAFKSYDMYTGTHSWVGLSNFAAVFKDIGTQIHFQAAIKNSFIACAVSIVVGITLALLFSFYIYKKKMLSGLFKVFLFLPVIVSNIALVFVFKFFCEDAIPNILFKLFNVKIPGLVMNLNTSFVTVLFFTVWSGFGVSVLMYSNAMSGISDSIVEAAQIDGITPFKEFLFITFPLIYPTFVTFVVVSVAGLFMSQMNLFSFFGNSAEFKVYTVGYYLYSKVASLDTKIIDYPELSAFGLILTFISVPLTYIVKWALEKVGPKV